MRRAECVVDVEDLTPARLLLQRMAYNITIGSVGYPGIKIQDTRSIRLFEAHTSGGDGEGNSTSRSDRVPPL
jgi:hypothetical protein